MTVIQTMARDGHVSKEMKDLALIAYSFSLMIHPFIHKL